MTHHWSGVLALVAAAGALSVLELDVAEAGQLMIARPIVLGPLFGGAFGRLELGAGLGLLCELFSLEELPVGGNLPLNPAVAVGAALLLALGPAPLAPALAFPAGLLAGWVHAGLEGVLRRRRAGLPEGQPLGGLAVRELAAHAAMTLGVLSAALVLRPVLRLGWRHAPEMLRAGLELGFALAPWLAAASLLRSLRFWRAR